MIIGMYSSKRSITWEETARARRHLETETGAIIKDWGGRLPFAFIYPNTYYIGMSNLGLQAVYAFLNRYEDILCERIFWEKETRQSCSTPLSIESQRPPADFAVLAFSLNYELDYFNIAPILKASGIPVYAEERDESHPLIIAGGPCITANPMPVAPFFDCLCIGEAEALLPAMLPVIREKITTKRWELLNSLAEVPGILVPQHGRDLPVKRLWAKHLDDFPVHSVVLTRNTEFNDMYLIEVQRGCAHGCRFCLVTGAYSPMRFRSAEKLIQQAQEGLQYRHRIGMMGPAVTDHPDIEEIMENLLQMGASISVSSLRLSSLNPRIIEMMVKGGLRSISLAPEAGSECLRTLIKKGLHEEQILQAINIAAEKGMQQIKLYFMIGLPGETDDDVQAIADLVTRGLSIASTRHRKTRLAINVSPFIPKAGTPFQWFPMASTDTLKHRIALLKELLAGRGIEIKHESPQWSEIQAVLSRGDMRLARVLAEMEQISLSGFRHSCARHDIDVEYFAHQLWQTTQKLPWSLIDSGIDLRRLIREFELSHK